jgi:regulation of enolase protein 1 (concanavalin A-like superfamily)
MCPRGNTRARAPQLASTIDEHYVRRGEGNDMKQRNFAWSDGRWTTEPVAARRVGEELVVEAAKGSDFWQKTLYGFQRVSGHALLTPWEEPSAVEVSFELQAFDELYDQAGLMLWVSGEQWIKAGIEVNDGIACVGAVVTDGYSDWSLAPVPEWNGRRVTVRASRSKDAVIVRAMANGHAWRTIRVCRFEPRSGAQVGPFVCAPERAGLQVRFTRWAFTEPDVELHWSPPVPEH